VNSEQLGQSGPTSAADEHFASLRRLRTTGFGVIALFAGTLGVWSMTAQLHGAVTATGQFVVASDIKKVQHPTGGVVGQLLVKEGDHVQAGDIVLRLDETIARTNVQIVSKQLNELAARTARLEAERDNLDSLAFSDDLVARQGDPEIEQLIVAENRLFSLRRDAREGQQAQLRKRVAQLADEIAGLKAQQDAKVREASIIATELQGVQHLYERNLVNLTRLSELQRQQASLEGQRGQLTAAIAQSEGKIAETELQIIQIDVDVRAEALKELREIQAREGELVERRVAAEDQLRRIDLRAPSAGTVHQLAVHTVGGVLPAGEPAMLVVPDGDDLQLEVQISPRDIDQVEIGKEARIRVQAGNQANNPELAGSVVRIGADVIRDERQGTAYYMVRVAIPRNEIERLAPVVIIAGMQAEAFIETVKRTPLDFLLKPISTRLARAFRER
jgi:HlyD family secretion protein